MASFILKQGQVNIIMFCPDLKIDEPSHVTTTEICHEACFFFIFKNNTTECISYNTAKLKKGMS